MKERKNWPRKADRGGANCFETTLKVNGLFNCPINKLYV